MSIHTIVINHEEQKFGEFHFDDFRHLNVVETFYCGAGDMVRELEKERDELEAAVKENSLCVNELVKQLQESDAKLGKLQRESAQSGWLPIDSAPKDGEMRFFMVTDGLNIMITPIQNGSAEGWNSNPYPKVPLNNITHYMPLPAPPESKES